MLHGLLARNSTRSALILRRGTHDALLVAWDRKDDSFQEGQWLKGRVDVNTSDISPDGTKIVYAITRYGKPDRHWAAISRIPYWTALVFWPEMHRGGVFLTDHMVGVYCHTGTLSGATKTEKIAPWFTPEIRCHAKNFKIVPMHSSTFLKMGDQLFPVKTLAQPRASDLNGWRQTQEGKTEYNWKSSAEFMSRTTPPDIKEKSVKIQKNTVTLRITDIGYRSRMKSAHPRYGKKTGTIEEITVVDKSGESLLDREFFMADWVELDTNADLLFTQKRQLFRLKPTKTEDGLRYRMEEAKLLLDLTGRTISKVETPPSATKW